MEDRRRDPYQGESESSSSEDDLPVIKDESLEELLVIQNDLYRDIVTKVTRLQEVKVKILQIQLEEKMQTPQPQTPFIVEVVDEDEEMPSLDEIEEIKIVEDVFKEAMNLGSIPLNPSTFEINLPLDHSYSCPEWDNAAPCHSYLNTLKYNPPPREIEKVPHGKGKKKRKVSPGSPSRPILPHSVLRDSSQPPPPPNNTPEPSSQPPPTPSTYPFNPWPIPTPPPSSPNPDFPDLPPVLPPRKLRDPPLRPKVPRPESLPRPDFPPVSTPLNPSTIPSSPVVQSPSTPQSSLFAQLPVTVPVFSIHFLKLTKN